jgi:hypothetical protein
MALSGDGRWLLAVTEAFDGAIGAAAASYAPAEPGTLAPISGSVGDTRSEVCWGDGQDDGAGDQPEQGLAGGVGGGLEVISPSYVRTSGAPSAPDRRPRPCFAAVVHAVSADDGRPTAADTRRGISFDSERNQHAALREQGHRRHRARHRRTAFIVVSAGMAIGFVAIRVYERLVKWSS